MLDKSDHDLLLQIHATLLGTNGQGGLYRQVEQHTKAIQKLWIIVALIIASIGGGSYAIMQKFLGG